ncbi:PREDICTED: serine/arginine repetitive matrix protein 2 [Rhagoletis zephyria]|uniref:serine/arginine repetitive matrix protein 2 n=1 Tax=Rhagoletis zephyria TaxID=28612 RepID=UPI0008113E33|nr:PREDICTED: serine/arginine repetitive matrix protein 2 [Rhagoletis zephyria]XP_036329757.1 serine/arginine repetitive matrix protein 2 [Rhagoletis pomonella]
MSASISKIHVTNSTGLSLNERFTAVQDRRREVPERTLRPPRPARDTSVANRRLLQQLARRHKMQTALKLKNRSMRPIGGNVAMRRGTIKALRVAANGKPIRTNSLTTVATMEADLISNGQRTINRPFRRANSVSNRLGSRRPLVGGAAQRIAQRRLQRTDMVNDMQRRGRSRSRSRVPVAIINLTRSRSRSTGRRGPGGQQMRDRSRSRSRVNAGARANLPIKARLGRRPGTLGRPRRNASGIRGVAQGRIQRRRNSNTAAGVGGRAGRIRGRSMTRNTNATGRSRSRSRTRNGAQTRTQSRTQLRTRSQTRGGSAVGQRNIGSVQGGRARGRSQQRRGGRTAPVQRNGKANGNKNGQQQQQQRRGRSRSRGGRGGRNQGKNAKPDVDKDKLDKELDQYMATTRTEGNDFLLRN